jgi:hypothetical protein
MARCSYLFPERRLSNRATLFDFARPLPSTFIAVAPSLNPYLILSIRARIRLRLRLRVRDRGVQISKMFSSLLRISSLARTAASLYRSFAYSGIQLSPSLRFFISLH